MLVQRLRRWTNIKATLWQCLSCRWSSRTGGSRISQGFGLMMAQCPRRWPIVTPPPCGIMSPSIEAVDPILCVWCSRNATIEPAPRPLVRTIKVYFLKVDMEPAFFAQHQASPVIAGLPRRSSYKDHWAMSYGYHKTQSGTVCMVVPNWMWHTLVKTKLSS